MNAVAQLQPSRLPIAPAVAKEFDLTSDKWRVLVEQIFPSAKSVEAVTMALSYCRARNLDIYKKPVHIVPMWNSAARKMVETVWPGIAEIRTTATRTGEYAGIDAVEFGPMEERTFTGSVKRGDGWEDQTKKVRFPEWASVVVYRIVKGQRCAYHAKVYWEETYATTGRGELPNEMWSKRPRGQLDKCVEAAALRKAFPEELGNVYAAEEMEGRPMDGVTIDHAAAPEPPKPPKPPAPPTETVEHTDQDTGEIESVDIKTGEIIDDKQIVPETGEDTGAVMEDGVDEADFLHQLEGDLACCMDEETLEEVWNAADPLARFEGNDDAQKLATMVRKRHLKRIGGGNG